MTGVKLGVPYAAEADWVLVPARLAERRHRGGGGQPGRGRGDRGAHAQFRRRPRVHAAAGRGAGDRRARRDRRRARPGDAVTGLYQLAVAGACCVADGALAAALALTTEHLRTRQQFGRPLATFQAAAQHIADVYIAARTLHLATLSACWRLAAGLDAGPDLDVAAYWLAEHGPAAMRTCHHLHGGIGMDVSYPLHRLLRAGQGPGPVRRRGQLHAGPAGRPGLRRQRCSSTSPTEQRALRDEVRAYFAGLLTPAEREALLTERHGTVLPRGGPADGPRRLAGRGLAAGVRRARPRPGRAADLRERGGPGRRPAARGHPADRRPHPAGARHAGAEGPLPAPDPGRRGALRDRVHRAGGRHRPGVAADPGGPGRRRVRRATARRSSPPAATTPTTSGWPAAPTPRPRRHKGISILIVDTRDPGYSWTPIITHDGAHHVNATYYDDVRVPAAMRVGAENGGWRLITDAAQPRAGDARPGRPAGRAARPGPGLGSQRPVLTAARWPSSPTCAACSPAATPACASTSC